MTEPVVPASASDHPARWKFDMPIFHAETRSAVRAWLLAHHATERGVWLATWRTASGRPVVPYPEVVEEAICVGWIDSTVNVLDDDRRLQLLTPRKPRSGWTRLNRERAARMEAQGLMTDAGRRAVAAAQANGWWTIYDPVEAMVEPEELAAALDGSPSARAAWERWPPSVRKQQLWSIVSAAKPETRARRIAAIIDAAESGRRP